MRLIAIVYLLGLAAIAVTLVYPGPELAGAKMWLNRQYNMHFDGSATLQSTITLVLSMLVFFTVTLFAVIRALDT